MLFISSVGITDPKKVKPVEGSPFPSPRTEPFEATGLGVEEATELLDWLEGRGVSNPLIEADPLGRLTIRWEEVQPN